jgi:hypothetical protein
MHHFVFKKQMENCKRKREPHGEEHRVRECAQIPEDIVAKLNVLRSRFTEFIMPELKLSVVESLEAGRLTPDLIYEQVQESADRGNTQSQIEAVYKFLMNHYNAIVRGEHPLPVNSMYRKVPFS